ncbi:MAG TPA: MOSC domain-containing protein [Anaerolineales bacterium]|jgi:MOSC domain-containing protein YiiM|nr:MOSC domain-containing protein [Anaerolineales bacterium]|tara:strand:+ start:450 stop:905 length:456 start_codon:yes stop_codon:yes gene_type:complete
MLAEKYSRPDASVRHIFLKTALGAPMRPVGQATAISAEGLQDDASRGRRKRQVLLIELGTLRDFGLNPGDVRENIVVTGLPLAANAPGTRLRAGACELEVTTDCAPCDYIDSLQPGLQERIIGCRGTLCRTISGGEISVGDAVALIARPSR